jgi:hypothetical protein
VSVREVPGFEITTGDRATVTTRYLCVHGHFYQPPRHDPFRGEQVRVREPGAEPYRDFNEKITAECYRPNAVCGNFGRISFDLGPTLASWLATHAPETLGLIRAAERDHRAAHGVSNALAQPYGHAILPLATPTEKRLQVAWGVADYVHRFGHRPDGMWLPETAVDLPTLRVLADHGIAYTVLAPWQAADPIDPTEPCWIDLGDGRRLAAFFYHSELSGGVSFDAQLTTDADRFGAEWLPRHVDPGKEARGEPQLLLVATDGELYGHHQPWRDRFLAHLLEGGAPANGFAVTSLGAHLRRHPPCRTVAIQPDSAWSCRHRLARWSSGCSCTEGDSAWKRHLRHALTRLAARLDLLYEQTASQLARDPGAARLDYVEVRLGARPPERFLEEHGRGGAARDRAALGALLEGQYYRQLMFTSCGFFFEDLDRIEPRNNVAFAARAIACQPREHRRRLTDDFLDDLAAARSPRTGRTGADILRAVLEAARDTPAAGNGAPSEPTQGDEYLWKLEPPRRPSSPVGSPSGGNGCRY